MPAVGGEQLPGSSREALTCDALLVVSVSGRLLFTFAPSLAPSFLSKTSAAAFFAHLLVISVQKPDSLVAFQEMGKSKKDKANDLNELKQEVKMVGLSKRLYSLRSLEQVGNLFALTVSYMLLMPAV